MREGGKKEEERGGGRGRRRKREEEEEEEGRGRQEALWGHWPRQEGEGKGAIVLRSLAEVWEKEGERGKEDKKEEEEEG